MSQGEPLRAFPRATAIGSLCAYVSGADPANYQPANITFDLLPKLEQPPRDKKARYAEVCRRALAALEEFAGEMDADPGNARDSRLRRSVEPDGGNLSSRNRYPSLFPAGRRLD